MKMWGFVPAPGEMFYPLLQVIVKGKIGHLGHRWTPMMLWIWHYTHHDSPRQTCCVKWITDPNSFIPFFSGKMKSCSSSSWLILSSWFSIFPIVVIVRGNVIDINVYLPGSGQRWRWSSHISCLLEILHTQDALKYSFIGYCLH